MDRLPTVAASKSPPPALAPDGDPSSVHGEPESGRAEELRAEPGWRKLLAGTPREVLARLVQDDPLGVRERVAARLQADALLLDADRVQLRVLARISRFAARYRGRPELSAWIDSAAIESVDELLREEHEAGRSRRAEASEKSSVFTSLAPPLGLDPTAMRAACAAFNLLPLAERTTFIDIVLSGKSLDKAAREAGVSASEVGRRARRALDVILSHAFDEHQAARPGGST